MPNSIEAQRKPAGKPKLGGYFCVDVLTIDELIARGMTATELLAYFVLGAGTDAENMLTRSGRLAISTALACSRYEAGQIVDRLVALEAVESLENGLADRRDPTATRFRLLRPAGPAAPSREAVLPNPIVRDPASATALRMAARLGGVSALRALIQIALPGQTDPLEERAGLLPDPSLLRIGSTQIARFDLFPLADLAAHHPIRFGRNGAEIALLSGLGLITHDLWTASLSPEGKPQTLLSPVGSLLRGLPSSTGTLAQYRLIAWLLYRLAHVEPGTVSAAELVAEYRHDEAVHAVLPLGWPASTVVALPRLTKRPDDAIRRETVRSDALAAQGAMLEIGQILERHLPWARPTALDVLRALEP